ncbi:MAG: winged helix DNA-binding protein [Alphaproteobacteria bacterium]|nr:MAG: winged helix DNA-binding protein [Alphaproteobacteria bacterium]
MQHPPYYDLVLLIERLHRRFLDLLKAELSRLGIEDITNVQALILYNLGDEVLTVGDLTTRGYYQGTNVSYSVEKMVENGYLLREPSPHDKRSVRVRASDKGTTLRSRLQALMERQAVTMTPAGISAEDMTRAAKVLGALERAWA